MMDLHPGRDLELAQHAAHGRVLDLLDRLHRLDPGIDDLVPVLEEWRQLAQADVAVLVDRGAEHGTAMLPEPGRVVGAATEEGDPERGAGDDHGRGCSRVAVRMEGAAARLSGVPMSMKR